MVPLVVLLLIEPLPTNRPLIRLLTGFPLPLTVPHDFVLIVRLPH